MIYVALEVGHQLSPFEEHALILETPDKKERFDQRVKSSLKITFCQLSKEEKSWQM